MGKRPTSGPPTSSRCTSATPTSTGGSSEVLTRQPSDMGGLREITFVVKGDDAWSRLKHEAGPHRVQRVPVTESQGRVHTSAATVTVLPEAEEVDVEVDPNDLKIDVYRSSGPGGQSVNTTDSAVRDHAQAVGSRRHLPGREEPAAEQGQGDAHPAQPPLRDRARAPGAGAVVGAPQPGEERRSLRQDPHVQLQGEPGHRSPHRSHPALPRPGARRPARRPHRRAGRPTNAAVSWPTRTQ